MADPVPAPTPAPAAPVELEEFYSSWSLFLVCLLLIVSLWTSYYLQIKRIRAVHETLVSIVAGMFVGFIIRLAPGNLIKDMLTFKHTLFFNLLLPPIILNSGYELKQENFFRNFGSILVFAFAGTFISAVGIGVLVYVWSFLGLEGLDLSLLECLIFGTTLSATDPVTILSIFTQYKVDPKLYTIIFGESLLNDAVSIVMYETLSQFHGTDIYMASFAKGTGIFFLSFSVSMALGVTFGLAMSLVLKHSHLSQYPAIETSLVALVAYTSYFFSNGLSMSGIVSLLFCGITLKHYAYHTMSRRTQRATRYIFSTLAHLSENFIFIYLGLGLFTSPPAGAKVTSYFKPLLIAITTVAVVFTRYAAVFPLSEIINFILRHGRGQRQDELPHSYQMMLFWAGLRGAVGVALAAGFVGENAETLRQTVLVVVVLTVVVFGGTTARMLEVLGIRTGVEDEAGTDSEEDVPPQWYVRANSRSNSVGPRNALNFNNFNYNHHTQQSGLTPSAGAFSAASSDSYDSDGGEVLPLASTSHAGPSGTATPPARRSAAEDGKWFQDIDERFLLPLFSNATASRSFHARRAMRSRADIPDEMDVFAGGEDDGGPEVELGVPRGRPMPGQNGVEESRVERGFSSPALRGKDSSDSSR